MRTWTINGKGSYRSLAVALLQARRKHPDYVWGRPYQGSNGRMRVVGKRGEADDVLVIEQR